MTKKHMCKSIKLMSVICTIVLLSQIFTILTFGANGIQPGVNDQEIISDHVYHIKAYNGKYFDVVNAQKANGTNVWLYALNLDATCQEWMFTEVGTHNGDKLYKIKDINSGKLLSIEASSSAYAANAWIWEDDGTTGQVFKLRDNGDGTFSFLTQCSDYSKVLSYDSNMSVRQYPDSSADKGTHFTIEFAGMNRYKQGKGVCDGWYIFHNVGYNTIPYYFLYKPLIGQQREYLKLLKFEKFEDIPEFYLVYRGGGYYSIRTTITGGVRFLTAPSSTSSGQKITWSSTFDSSDNNQLWSISLVSGGNTYTIKSKNIVNAGLNYGLSATSSYLEQRTVSSTQAQWKLFCNELDYGDSLLVGISDSSHSSHSSWMGDAMSALYDGISDSFCLKYQSDMSYTGDLTPAMQQCRVMIMRGHGAEDGSRSYMVLSETATSNDVRLTSDDVRGLNMINTEIVLYIGCYTAGNYLIPDARNLLTESVNNAKAKIAVGFNNTIDCPKANEFAKCFAEAYREKLLSYTNYSSMSNAEKLNTRINAFKFAVQSAAEDATLEDTCVMYSNSQYTTYNN